MAPGSGSLCRSVRINSMDSASKRKRANRSAKLKQCKLEVRREQWLGYQVTEHQQGEKSLHAEKDSCIHDPGEVINPKSATSVSLLPMDSQVSWASFLNSSASARTQQNPEKMHSIARVPTTTEAEPDPDPDPDPLSANFNVHSQVSLDSLLNSSISAETQQNPEKMHSMTTEAEPDPDLLRANSNLRSHLHIKRSGQKESSRNSSLSPNPNRCAAYECGDPDVSPKSSGERSPSTKASKVGRGSMRSRAGCGNSKENECLVADHVKENKGQQKTFVHGQEHHICYSHETEDSWEAAADALGLHSVPKKSSNVLQTQAMHHNDRRHMRMKSPSLLGRGPSKQPDLQRSAHGKAWMQGNLQRPPSLPSLTKQRGVCAQTCLKSHSEKAQCPICTEELDSTDTLFDSCPCGFSLCLFCYHKIASDNNRCPGCRGVYTRDISVKPLVVLPC